MRKKIFLAIFTVVILSSGVFFLWKLWTNLNILQNRAATTNQTSPTAPALAATIPVNPAATDILKITSRDHIRGNKYAKIAFIEYADLECPYCKTFQPTLKEMLTTYPTQIVWVYRQFPLIIHANAQKEGEASECVYDQGGDVAFWKFVDLIYERTTSNGTGFALDQLGPTAAEIGLNQTTFQKCLDSGKYAQYLSDQENAGVKAGVSGTPGGFIVNLVTGQSQSIPGAVTFAQLKTMIDGMLK